MYVDSVRSLSLGFFSVFFLVANSLVVPFSYADAQSGRNWLLNQIQPDGGIYGADDAALEEQSSLEALLTLQTIGDLDITQVSSAENFLQSIPQDASTENLARTIRYKKANQQNFALERSQLLQHQQYDGGFGAGPGFESDALSTAFAIIALGETGYSGQPVGNALGWLLGAQQADGSWLTPDGAGSVEVTALTHSGLWLYRHIYNFDNESLNAQNYLLSQQQADGLWGAIEASALVLTALLTANVDRAPFQPSLDAFSAFQSVEGDFQADVYLTALALRVLRIASDFAADDTRFSGLVLASETGLPINGATLDLSGPVTTQFVADFSGGFALGQLPPGNYQLTVSANGFEPVPVSLRLLLGQKLQLGDIYLSPEGTGLSTSGRIYGSVQQLGTKDPLEGVVVTLVDLGISTVTDANGQYQFIGVEEGNHTIQFSKMGLLTTFTGVTLTGGTLFNFSPHMDIDTGVTGTAVTGLITHAQTNEPIEGAAVTLNSSSLSLSTLTDAFGRYALENLVAGEVTSIAISKAGFDTAQVSYTPIENQVESYTPALYPEGVGPTDPNTSRVFGTLIDASTNLPLDGVIVELESTETGAIFSGVSDADGNYFIGNIPEFRFLATFTKEGYATIQFGVRVGNLDGNIVYHGDWDLGITRIGLATEQAAQLPDLIVSQLDDSALQVDAETALVTGELTVSITNQGTALLSTPIAVQAFFDLDADGEWSPSLDAGLGHEILATSLLPNQIENITIRLAGGEAVFRDMPVKVWVDSDYAVAELNEANNWRSTSQSCEVNIGAAIKPVLKLGWPAAVVNGSIRSTPLVAPLYDTNNDGNIDNLDHPMLVVIRHSGRYYQVSNIFDPLGDIYVFDGVTQELVLQATDLAIAPNATAHAAVGDIDGDGVPEIVAITGEGGVVAYNNDGSMKWFTPEPGFNDFILPGNDEISAVSLADLEGDGFIEILVHDHVLNHDGTVRTVMQVADNWAIYQWASTYLARSMTPVDMDLDGIVELVHGGRAYNQDGSPFWKTLENPYWASHAIGNFDEDPYPEIVVNYARHRGGSVALIDHDGQIIWKIDTPQVGNSGGAAPLVADMDGDGLLEIAISTSGNFLVYNHDGSLLWAKPQYENEAAASTVFDFQGDGLPELVYANEEGYFIANAATGESIVEYRHPQYQNSDPNAESPIVADLDADGHAEIVFVHTESDQFTHILEVFENTADDWMPTRKIWNQAYYYANNVNDDGSIPAAKDSSWQNHNTFRVNPVINANGYPDLSLKILSVVDNGVGQDLSVMVRIGNPGAVGISTGNAVELFDGDPNGAGLLITNALLPELPAGHFIDISFNIAPTLASGLLVAVVDRANTVSECREQNNRADRLVRLASAIGTASIRTDAISYTDNQVVTINASITNQGNFAAEYLLSLRVEDAQNYWVTDFPAKLLGPIHSGDSVTVTEAWNTGTVPAGNYHIVATLTDSDSNILEGSEVTVAVVHDIASAPAATVRIISDRTTYHIDDTVTFEHLARNDSVNLNLSNLAYVVSVTNGAGVQVFTETINIAGFAPSQLRTFTSQMTLAGAVEGHYTATATLITNSQEALDSDSIQFTVASNSFLLVEGSVTTQNAQVLSGEIINCADTLNNVGVQTVSDLTVQQLLVDVDKQITVDTKNINTTLAVGETQTFYRAIGSQGLLPGNYACVLRLSVAGTEHDADFVALKLLNSAPSANAGADHALHAFNVALLDGSGSYDPSNQPLTYLWQLVSAPSTSSSTLQNANTAVPSLLIDAVGDFIVQLVVSDGDLASTADTVIITGTNSAPVANAGPDQLVRVGDRVSLNGAGSTDFDGDALSYAWEILSQPTGSNANLSYSTSVMPQLSIDDFGTYNIQLLVNDGFADSLADTVILTVENVPPVANAGEDVTGFIDDTIVLDGNQSSDIDGDSLSYQWQLTEVPIVSSAILTHADTAQPSLTLDTHGTYVAELIVHDGIDNSEADTITISTLNSHPVADAGAAQVVFVGDVISLDGLGSYDSDGDPFTYQWSLLSKPVSSSMNLVDATSATPAITIDAAGIYVVQLIVNDGIDLSEPDTVVLSTQNMQPTAEAGSPRLVDVGEAVTLDGSDSLDPDGDALSYSWSLINLPIDSAASLDNSGAVYPTFFSDVAGDYIVQLVVNDGELNSAPDTVTVTAEVVVPSIDCAGAIAYPDNLWPPNHKFETVNVEGLPPDSSIQIIQVRQDELIGNKQPDAIISEDGASVKLRREREGNLLNGRVYHVHFTATDSASGSCQGKVTVGVPHSKKDTAVNDGELYDSL